MRKARPKFYKLVEFPYPSGNLHMGHWYAFAVPDIFARYKRMQGYDVMYPIGFDAFGLPAENAAIKNNLQPADWTKKNIATMTKQMKSMGTMFDWSRSVSTIDPDYYRWTQWIFLQFYKAGLAYRAKTLVNWCPKDKTVLANEQVVDGACERCGTTVEQREREQWMYRITKYADALLEGLDRVDWPRTTRIAQENWIGKSEGAVIKFGEYEVFTTRPDTIFGATYLVLAPEHPFVSEILNSKSEILNKSEITKYINEAKKKTNLQRQESKEKTGVFTGLYAINPVSKFDATQEPMPIWIADYVLGNYGTGAIMGVPAHDKRDYEFATKVIKSAKLVQTVSPTNPPKLFDLFDPTQVYEGEGWVINSGQFTGMSSEQAKWEITKAIGGKRTSTYRLRDWILSRQRYWGTPIPMINCPACGYQPVSEKELPIKLPKLDNYLPADDGSSPLARAEKWVKVKCPACGGEAKRETDTMDTFVDSSWYFLRYTDPDNKKEFASKEKMAKWMPVDLYTGGAEHNTMHLLYSRFFIKALHELGFVDFDEPFKVRRNHGMVLGPDGVKMSKSKGNVIDPDKEVAQYGADAVRIYLAFLGPYDTFNGPWNPDGIVGISRFLNRIRKIANAVSTKHQASNHKQILNKAIKKVGEDIENLHFNTAISELMKLLNEREIVDDVFLKLLSPFAPHLTEELWSKNHATSIHAEDWPEYDPALIAESTAHFAVQINGKTRAVIELPVHSDEQVVRSAAEADEKVKRHLIAPIQKVIFVKAKLINFVLRHIQ